MSGSRVAITAADGWMGPGVARAPATCPTHSVTVITFPARTDAGASQGALPSFDRFPA